MGKVVKPDLNVEPRLFATSFKLVVTSREIDRMWHVQGPG